MLPASSLKSCISQVYSSSQKIILFKSKLSFSVSFSIYNYSQQFLPAVSAMTERLNINKITPSSQEWTCKVQVVDKGHPRNNKEGTRRYQLMILQDAEEPQIRAVMYGSDITRFEEAFIPFQTYLVSTTFVRESIRTYGEPLHQFFWTVDNNTIVEPIKEVILAEQPLAPPTHLKLASFDSFDYQPIDFEFDILAIVINGSPPSYASNGNRIQEFIIIDRQ